MKAGHSPNNPLSLISEGKRIPVVVVGGGQAGLSASACLSERSIEHIVFEKERVAWEWETRRWDTFCLVTPNWQCRLPGFPYRGSDPDGFMDKNEIIAYIRGFVDAFKPPLFEGVAVEKIESRKNVGFQIETTIGRIFAEQVVIATGPYQIPSFPCLADDLPDDIEQIHSSNYKSSKSLKSGNVLVVGSGQSGCQIAEDLHISGRKVHLAVGSAPRVARRYRGKDVVKWLEEMGHYNKSVGESSKGVSTRDNTNHYVTGRDGGHDIDLRAFALDGMGLHGRLRAVSKGNFEFDNDLEKNLNHADGVSESIKDLIDIHIGSCGLDAPTELRYKPVWQPTIETSTAHASLPLSEISTVIWATGFHSDYSWIQLPVLDDKGNPIHTRGCAPIDGIYFLGLPWLHSWGSARFGGIAADAAHVADQIMNNLGAEPKKRSLA